MYVDSIIKFGRNFYRSDCYVSNKRPIRFLEIPHYFPTGPYIIYTSFKVEIIPLKNEELPIEKVMNITFLRYDDPDIPCSNNFSLSANGILFKEMLLTINLYLIDSDSLIGYFKYTFKNGFIPGRHLLLSRYNAFGIIVRIDYSDKENSGNMNMSIEIDWEFLQIFTTVSTDICFTTRNAGIVVLRPNYYDQKPEGLTTNIFIFYKVENEKTYVYKFSVFDCTSNDKFLNKNVIFFDEYPEKTKIFFASEHRYINTTVLQTQSARFNLSNFRREHISRRNNFEGVKRLFLLKEVSDIEQLPDGSNKTSYKSASGDVYSTYINKKTQVMLNIIREETIKLS